MEQGVPVAIASFAICRELLALMKQDDTQVLFLSQRSDARKGYLTSATWEVEKILYKILNMLSNEAFEVRSEIEVKCFESLSDDQASWKRKIMELLVEVSAFAQTNEDMFYRHLLAIRECQSAMNVLKDWKEFYDCENANLKRTLAILEERLFTAEGELELNRCWYLNKDTRSKKWVERDDYKKLNAIGSFRSRLQDQLPVLEKEEKLFVGLTYNSGYGVTSSAIHVSIGHMRGFASPLLTLKQGIFECLLGCLYSLKRIATLIHAEGLLQVASLTDALKENEIVAAVYKALVEPDIACGEVVYAPGGKALVTEVIVSNKYGYRSYKVTYNGRAPLGGIPHDHFIAPHVKLAHTQDEVADDLLKRYKSSLGEFVEGMSDTELRELIKESVQAVIKNQRDLGLI